MDLTPKETKDLIKALEACDKTVEACDVLVQSQKAMIELQSKIIDLNRKRVIQLEKQGDKTLEFILVTIGAGLLGVAVGR